MLSVVTLQFGALPYFEDSTAINAAYCARHGIAWRVCGAVELTDRHLVWSKVAIVAQALKTADQVLFLDADAVFVDHASPPADLLALLGRKALLFGLDAAGQANTGIVLARRSEATTRILSDWWKVPTHDNRHAFRWPLEQGALNRNIIGRHRDALALVPSSELTTIRHFAGSLLATKTRAISRERAKLCPSLPTQS